MQEIESLYKMSKNFKLRLLFASFVMTNISLKKDLAELEPNFIKETFHKCEFSKHVMPCKC